MGNNAVFAQQETDKQLGFRMAYSNFGFGSNHEPTWHKGSKAISPAKPS